MGEPVSGHLVSRDISKLILCSLLHNSYFLFHNTTNIVGLPIVCYLRKSDTHRFRHSGNFFLVGVLHGTQEIPLQVRDHEKNRKSAKSKFCLCILSAVTVMYDVRRRCRRACSDTNLSSFSFFYSL
jgi:hypothetical protein